MPRRRRKPEVGQSIQEFHSQILNHFVPLLSVAQPLPVQNGAVRLAGGRHRFDNFLTLYRLVLISSLAGPGAFCQQVNAKGLPLRGENHGSRLAPGMITAEAGPKPRRGGTQSFSLCCGDRGEGHAR